MATKTNNNYLIQTNFFTKSVLREATEVQREILYFIQSQIDFHDSTPTGVVSFRYGQFLKYKKVAKVKNAYSPAQFLQVIDGLRDINGVFYNKLTRTTTFFNLVDKVEVSESDPQEFVVTLASFGKIFFFEKYALEYVNNAKLGYTQIERNIIDLKGQKRKKFFELLSQYKATGLYRVPLDELKTLLGFIEYINQDTENTSRKRQLQLELLFTNDEIPVDYERVEYLQRWADFKRVFLDPAISEINKNSRLDITNVSYTTRKTGRRITSLEFKFQKRIKKETMSSEEVTAMNYFKTYGLQENQIIFLFQRIGHIEMYRRLNSMVTFNQKFADRTSPLYQRKVWFDNETKAEIKNLGGYLYNTMFPELKGNQ